MLRSDRTVQRVFAARKAVTAGSVKSTDPPMSRWARPGWWRCSRSRLRSVQAVSCSTNTSSLDTAPSQILQQGIGELHEIKSTGLYRSRAALLDNLNWIGF